MTLPISSSDPTFRIYLALSQYPVLRTRIRVRMMREMLERGVITEKEFEEQVRQIAIQSQEREGLTDPYGEEPEGVWETRLDRVRTHLVDLQFANNLPFELFEQIVRETLEESGAESDELLVSFNPELAPSEVLFEQALAIQKMPPEERQKYSARLQEIKVVLIRMMISDQLAYVNIAKEWLTIDDLVNIRVRKIGKGKIGGKAAGMLLAERILREVGEEDIASSIHIPDSYFLAADVMYTFMTNNDLMKWADQKYKSEEEIRAEYPEIRADYAEGEFPADIIERLQKLLDKIGGQPLIVRSSSLLEDNFGTSFAGKYESFFCPNQDTPEENLRNLVWAISQVYASGLNPDALLYRRAKGLQDYDERIAVLIQVVEGERLGNYFLPHAAGVAFSRNLFRWSPQIRREDGFLRLVWGLGTRAVERVGNDYPRLVALSHPLLHSQDDPKAIRGYSQRYVDLIDLTENEFKTMPVDEVLQPRYPVLRYLAQVYRDGYLSTLRTTYLGENNSQLVLTFDELLRRTPLADRMRRMLRNLERHYRSPVDVEFTVRVRNPGAVKPDVEIVILQCRPQSHLQESEIRLPKNLPEEKIIFSTKGIVPHGAVEQVRYVLFISPEGYYALPSPAARAELARAIGRLNAALEGEVFICIGPGRWGTSNPDLGVRISYSDIYHARALIEVSGKGIGPAPEPSFGTHFFQDLLESQIYPLAINLDEEDVIFNRHFFYRTPNQLAKIMPQDEELADCLRLIDVPAYQYGHVMRLVMDDDAGKAVAFFAPQEEQA